jgi:hypothetical protein
MTAAYHCGSNAVAAVRLLVDGEHDQAAALLNGLDATSAKYALFGAVEIAAATVRCLDRVDPDHGSDHLMSAGLMYAEPEAAS